MGSSPKLAGILVAAAAAAIAAFPVSGTAASRHAARSLASATFTDRSGDAKAGPDVTSVTVSDDAAGTITFAATIANRPSLTSEDGIQVFLDTDGNAATGGSGYEYEVAWISGHQLLMHWDGSAFGEVKAASFTASYADGKASFAVNKADLGGSTSFDLVITTTGDTGASLADRAPDSGSWVYPSGKTKPASGPPPPGSPPAPVKLRTVKPRLPTAVAGRAFTASLIVQNASTQKGVKGTLTCQAKVSGSLLTASRQSVAASGRASCTWRLPATAKRKTLKGSLTVSYAGARVSRSFSVAVR